MHLTKKLGKGIANDSVFAYPVQPVFYHDKISYAYSKGIQLNFAEGNSFPLLRTTDH